MKYEFSDITKLYRSLGPIDDIQEGEGFVEALNWAIQQKNIFNIALTGNYGSGKSSIIQTLLKKNNDINERTITISLADFNNIKKSGDSRLNNLEKGILKQLFYKLDSSSIPNSKFKKIRNINFKSDYLQSLFVLIIAFTALYFIFPNLIHPILDNFTSGIKNFLCSWILGLIAFAVSLALFLAFLVYIYEFYLTKIHINALNIGNNHFQVNTSHNETVFDKYLDEIIYFFEENKMYDTIIFEDLDRFNNLEIFIKLRELNRILNNDDCIKNRKITFVYAIRDDLFKDVERTKFFNFIIPVIPIINKNNASEELLKIMHGLDMYAVSDECIKTVSLYITEMRTLYNICNEYFMYIANKAKFMELSLSYDNLFSMIVFKNLDPNMFSRIQDGRGLLKKIFELKYKFVEDKIASIESIRIKENEELKKYNNDCTKSIRELKVLMFNSLANGGLIKYLSTSREGSIYYEDLIKDDFDLNKLFYAQSGNVTIYYTNITNYPDSRGLSRGLDDEIKPYMYRINYLIQKNKENQESICTKYENEYTNIQHLRQKSLKSLIETYSFEKIFKNFECSDLVRTLLIRGYIDEQYEQYINYFKEVSITANDTKFVLDVVQEKENHWKYRLDNPKSVVEALQESDFKRKYVYNYYLMDYLVESNDFENCLKLVIETICEDINYSISFLSEFLKQSSNINRFLPKLFAKWKDAADYIYYSNLSNHEKCQFFIYMIDYCDLGQIINLNSNNNISKFIVETPDLLRMAFTNTLNSKNDVSIWETVLDSLKIKFVSLNIDGVNHKLLDYIFDQDLYVLNKEMISVIVGYKDKNLQSVLNKQIYTTINKLNYKPMINYVNSNIKPFIDNVFLSEDNDSEDLEYIIEIIEKAIKLDDLTYISIFENKKFNIYLNDFIHIDYSRLTNITQRDVRDCILKNNHITPCWKYVIEYWGEYGYSDTLSQFVENNISKISRTYNGKLSNGFLYDFYNAYNIEFYKIHKIKCSFYKDVDFRKIKSDILGYLIENDLISPFMESFERLSKTDVDLFQQFALKYEVDFRHYIENYEIDEELYSLLMHNDNFTFETRFTLLESKDGLYMDEELAKSFMNDIEPFRPLIYQYVIEALKNIEELQIKTMMKYLNHLDKASLIYSFKCIERYQKVYESLGTLTRINKSQRNEELVEYMKSINMIEDYFTTSKQIEFKLLNE